MLLWLRSLFAGNRSQRRSSREQGRALSLLAQYRTLKAKYDAAQTGPDNQQHWANADGLSAAAANSPGIRRTLRNRSRYETANSGYAGGMITALANDLTGTGPTLQILVDDDAVSTAVEGAFSTWARSVCLGQKLHTMAQAKARDGEAFAIFTTNPRLPGPVQLDLRLVEADQVTWPWGAMPQTVEKDIGITAALYWDGIMYDAAGNPLSYTVLRYHPGDSFGIFPGQWDTFPASQVIHWFRLDRPGQLRGIPELQAALPLFAVLRRWTLATLSAAETAALFAALLKSNLPPEDTAEAPPPFDQIELERGMMMTLPDGYDALQLRPEHPTAEHKTFKREILKECGRPVSMPVNVVTGDSSDHNYASARLDHQGYRAAIRVERSFADATVLERIWAAFYAEARLIPGLLPAGANELPRAWFWPGWAALDKDDAKADTERLTNGTETLQSILSEWGVDWRESIAQRGRELKVMAENGVPPPSPPKAAPFGAGIDLEDWLRDHHAPPSGNGLHRTNGRGH